MHPGSDALTTLRQEYNSGLIPNSLDNARMLHQRATQLQLLVDHFRNQLTGDQISGAQNVNCAVTSPGPLVPVFPMDGDNRHRVRSKLTSMTADKGPEEDVRHSPQTNGFDSPQTEGLLFPCVPLFQQINRLLPGLIQPGLSRSIDGQDKSCSALSQSPAPLNPNLLAHLVHLHRLALNVFAHQDGLNSNPSKVHDSKSSSFSHADPPTVTLDYNRVSLPVEIANSSQALFTKALPQSTTTLSIEVERTKTKTALSSAEQNGSSCVPCEGLNLSTVRTKILNSGPNESSSFYSTELQRSSNCYDKPVFSYPFPDIESVLSRYKPSFLPSQDFWTNSHLRQMNHMLPAPFSVSHGRKLPYKSLDGTYNANPYQQYPSPYESTPHSEEPRLVRLSNCSLKPIDQLTVSDFVSSALHPTANGHSSPVAASLTEALLNQCGLELSWVKLSHIRERPGSQFVWLLFNVSSKRHRLPVGTTERIQGRHSSRMLWPQFSGKSFKMHKKLSFDARKDQPFFVHSLGWSSIDPCAAWKIWGLACRQLTVDDICLVLIRQTGNVRKPRSQIACSTENNPRHVTDHCTPPSICKKHIRQNARETTERGYCLSNTLSLPDVESRTIKYDQETASLKSSVAHGSFPRNFVPLKRPSSMEEGYSSLMDHETTNEIYNAGNGGLSKRPKTDEPQQQSENRSEKSIFFSATSLAQSHDTYS
ncbi:hypothetical protein D915_000450 [Fasciola hepatica]|uniref:AXH domain-containing protein n=1 Tax=Fasciola hepatica TaxID=6192 RepID=A0A4E0RNZ6_FASHE|nr:hypothetical protein D915_000450 [Fasciola hepatica]